ncbi:MAG: hypothetical protein KGD63_00830 [Candidatus Lokiarchaeota archaeon]|nr:hypothetical protein [Candidatus Lokiarchaeota archaeon]
MSYYTFKIRGTYIVKDISTDTLGSYPHNFIEVNEILYFVATDGNSGFELFRTDGTELGTYIVRDIWPAGSYSSLPEFLTELNSLLFFVAEDGVNGVELWMF